MEQTKKYPTIDWTKNEYHQLKLEFAKKFPTLIQYLKTINTSLPKNIFENTQRISSVSKSKQTPTALRGEAGVGPYGVPSRANPKDLTVEADDVVGVSDKNIDSEPKQNYAVKLANIALSITKNNKERHDIIENFMLINDTATIATEIPIYLTKEESPTKQNLTGHIDILQIRYHKLYI